MKWSSLTLCAVFCAACSSTSSSSDPIPDASVDSGHTGNDGGEDARSDGSTKGDSGPNGTAVLHAHARDLAVNSGFLGTFDASHVSVRRGPPPTAVDAGSCIYLGPPSPAVPTLQAITLGGLSMNYSSGGYIEDGFGYGSAQLVPDGASPPPFGGSEIMTGTTLAGPPTPFSVDLQYGAPSRTVHGEVVPPEAGPTITAPSTCPTEFDADFAVAWTPTTRDAYVEVELANSDGTSEQETGGTVVCRPSSPGTVTIPYVAGRPPTIVRISVFFYAESDVNDEDGDLVSVLAEKGAVLAP